MCAIENIGVRIATTNDYKNSYMMTLANKSTEMLLRTDMSKNLIKYDGEGGPGFTWLYACVRDPLDDDVHGRPLVQEPVLVRARHHDVEVQPGPARLLVPLRGPEPYRVLDRLDDPEVGAGLGDGRAAIVVVEVLAVRVLDAGVARAGDVEPCPQCGRDHLEVLLVPLGLFTCAPMFEPETTGPR